MRRPLDHLPAPRTPQDPDRAGRRRLGEIKATWFNQPWLEKRLLPGTEIRLRGRANKFGFAVSSHDLDDEVETADFAPVYPATQDLSQKKLRHLRSQVLPLVRAVGDPLPAELRATEKLPLRSDALFALHRPRSFDDAEAGGSGSRSTSSSCFVSRSPGRREPASRRSRSRSASPASCSAHIERRCRSSSPPTSRAAIVDLDADLARSCSMHRLLQGDVGSGKTVVALYALLRAVEAGRQAALMAPTETLAEQHFLTIESLCGALGISVVLLDELAAGARARSCAPAHRLGGTPRSSSGRTL